MVEMQLAQISYEDLSPHHVIVLKEKDGERSISMGVGIFEGLAIKRMVNKEPFPRPLTHDLIGNVIDALGGRLTKVAVTKLERPSGTFLAKLYIELDGKEVEVDSRPSDAIALATKSDAPIFAEEEVFQALELDKESE